MAIPISHSHNEHQINAGGTYDISSCENVAILVVEARFVL